MGGHYHSTWSYREVCLLLGRCCCSAPVRSQSLCHSEISEVKRRSHEHHGRAFRACRSHQYAAWEFNRQRKSNSARIIQRNRILFCYNSARITNLTNYVDGIGSHYYRSQEDCWVETFYKRKSNVRSCPSAKWRSCLGEWYTTIL